MKKSKKVIHVTSFHQNVDLSENKQFTIKNHLTIKTTNSHEIKGKQSTHSKLNTLQLFFRSHLSFIMQVNWFKCIQFVASSRCFCYNVKGRFSSSQVLNFFVACPPHSESIYFTRCDRNAHKCNIFSRKTNEACSFSLSVNVHRVVSRESERYEEFTFKKSIFFCILAHAYRYIKVMYSKPKEQNKTKNRKKVFQIYSSLWLFIHSCYYS